MSELSGVSIIVVSYNNERFLAAAINSVFGQNHRLCEVIGNSSPPWPPTSRAQPVA